MLEKRTTQQHRKELWRTRLHFGGPILQDTSRYFALRLTLYRTETWN